MSFIKLMSNVVYLSKAMHLSTKSIWNNNRRKVNICSSGGDANNELDYVSMLKIRTTNGTINILDGNYTLGQKLCPNEFYNFRMSDIKL